MQIHLCKPGGQREGPYSLEQINADLAARRYSGSDYWAWHEGLPEWVPLYSIPGVAEAGPETTSAPAEARPPTDKQAAAEEPPATESKPNPAQSDTALFAEQSTGIEVEKVSSGMPVSALEHMFILASGDGPGAADSATVKVMVEKISGESFDGVCRQVPRDVIGQCDILRGLKGQASMPGVVWRRMASLRPELLRQAREGSYRICVRSFPIENAELVSVFLFYNKQKL